MSTRFSLTAKAHFDAAHSLRGYNGPCANLHGHRWFVEVEVSSQVLTKIGFVTDFKDIKRWLDEVLPDHQHLNNFPEFENRNPTAENIASWLFTRLQPKVEGLDTVENRIRREIDPAALVLERVSVWETPECAATVRKGV